MVYFPNENIIMAKKLFLNTERVIPNAHVHSVSREEPEPDVASSGRNSPVSGITEQLPFLLRKRRVNCFQNLMQPDVVC